MNKMKVLCFIFLLSISISCNASPFYKKVDLDSSFSFEIPFLWKIKSVSIELPDKTREMITQYKSIQLIGKEVIGTSTFVEYKNQNANMEGAIKETISQVSSMKGITGFNHFLKDYSVKNAKSKICFMSYFTDNTKVYIKSIFIIPNNNPKVSYNLSGHYTKEYNQKVIDRIFSSIVIKIK